MDCFLEDLITGRKYVNITIAFRGCILVFDDVIPEKIKLWFFLKGQKPTIEGQRDGNSLVLEQELVAAFVHRSFIQSVQSTPWFLLGYFMQ